MQVTANYRDAYEMYNENLICRRVSTAEVVPEPDSSVQLVGNDLPCQEQLKML